ncbi:uncharacterized protein MYCFIDRAFT_81604 [Pseudocercospora fijiensis CIRAD86]|uniref:Uncharacterized protein n=1 Tax=Pseudocercospora fijiensis (strain CIRAD86) TaxID=383855 RepID=M2ZX38_PSEFD|nr:uncharacterized protein MYCFIDRAFT_81604 [Pseudocercospora fijiensis CIRAD86]EME83554.1 hypothetical protein MYCFIDRAFT_81604 [Pseudocercospora fijiensis CIRAD86]
MSSTNQPRQVSEEEFFRQLGLDSDNEAHMRIYAAAKAEVAEGYRRLGGNGTAVQENAFRQEVRTIYESASPATKMVYDRGLTSNVEDNWVIRWLLWQAISLPNGS